MSSEIKKKLEEEIQTLEKELREELPRALKTAAALGDLSENADYQAARERQDFVRVRLSHLKQRLADLSMINFDKIPRDRISLGSKVVLLDVDKNEQITYKLVTSEDANAPAGLISTTSPIGRSLLNKREGDTVEVKIPSGTRTFEIISFATMHDAQQFDARAKVHHRTDWSWWQTCRRFDSERPGKPSHPSQHPDADRDGH